MLKTINMRIPSICMAILFMGVITLTLLAQEPTGGTCSGSAPVPSGSTCWATVAWVVDGSTVEQATKSGTSSCTFLCSATRTSCYAEGDGTRQYLTSGA